MTEILRSYEIDTPGGKFVVYAGSAAESPDSHKPLYWYWAPAGWTGPPYSKDYYSSEAAEEALWESLKK